MRTPSGQCRGWSGDFGRTARFYRQRAQRPTRSDTVNVWIIIAISVLISLLLALRNEVRRLDHYRGRSCVGRLWRRQFPNAPKYQIRLFLDCFIRAMGFPPPFRLKFEPSDKIHVVYRSLYGGKTPLTDSLECESFLDDLSQTFGVEIEALVQRWHESVTLGELFSYVTQPARTSSAG
jgi:propanediol dehydratase small subunit